MVVTRSLETDQHTHVQTLQMIDEPVMFLSSIQDPQALTMCPVRYLDQHDVNPLRNVNSYQNSS